MLSTALKYAVAAFLVSTYKTLPFAYLLRFYYHIATILTLSRSKFLRTNRTNTFGVTQPKHLFKWVGLNTYVSPLEIDMYLHKSNSTYFLDLDIARTKLITTIFQKLFFNSFDNVSGEYKKANSIANYPYIPIATVQCAFKRELKPFQRFAINSRVLAWDQKWLFVLSKFTTKGPKGSDKLHAFAVTKYVFKKKGRITIPPVEFIKECGLWDESVEIQNAKSYRLVADLADNSDWEELCGEVQEKLASELE